MIKFLDVCLWIIGIFFLLCSLGLFLSPEVRVIGTFLALLGVSLLPPLRNRINNKLHTIFTVFSKNNNSENSSYILRKVFIGLFKFTVFSFLFIVCIASMPEPQNVNVKTSNENTVVETKGQYSNNKNAKLIANVTGIDKNKAGKIYEMLISCGVGHTENIELFADYSNPEQYEVPSKCYTVKATGMPAKLMMYVDKDGNISELYYDMKDIIIEGKRVASITDYILNSEEWLDLRVQGQVYIEKFLNAPKTAKYRNMNYSIDENKIIHVSGIVEAKNLYGVPLENAFEMEYTKTQNGNFILKKAVLAGQKIY
jgi:hypothetical protein